MSKNRERLDGVFAALWTVALLYVPAGCDTGEPGRAVPRDGSPAPHGTDSSPGASTGSTSTEIPAVGNLGGGGDEGTGGSTGGTGTPSTPDPVIGFGVTRDAAPPSFPPIPDAMERLDAAPAYWSDSYPTDCAVPAIGTRSQADGHHRPGENCMKSGCHLNPRNPEHHPGTDCRGSRCHSKGSPDGSGAPAFLFGGTVYRAGTLVADPGVQVGVKAVQGFYSACSAANGNFWVLAPTRSTTLTWTGATARLRNANGAAPMMSIPAAGCNATVCHTGPLKMTSP